MSSGIPRHVYCYQFCVDQTIRQPLGHVYLASIVAHARAAQCTLGGIAHELHPVILAHNGYGHLNLGKLPWNQLVSGGIDRA